MNDAERYLHARLTAYTREVPLPLWASRNYQAIRWTAYADGHYTYLTCKSLPQFRVLKCIR